MPLCKQIQHDIQQLIATTNTSQIINALERYANAKNSKKASVSSMLIDENYRIYLPDYNIEIQLSHLTKAMYLLFLKHPEGINLTDFRSYKEELFNIYKCISYQTSLAKMQQAVHNLAASKSEVYRQISRIKHELHKKLPKQIAELYCIKGKKAKRKKITSNCFIVVWSCEL